MLTSPRASSMLPHLALRPSSPQSETRFEPPPAQAPPARRINWQDAVWVFIVGGLATLWIMLLTSPAWR